MAAFFNSDDIKKISGFPIVIDTNILSSCYTNKNYFESFSEIFKNNTKLIDPIVQLEFLRGSFRKQDYEQKMQFLQYNNFYILSEYSDEKDFYTEIFKKTFDISRILSHHKIFDAPLGDIFIISRLAFFENLFLFLTLDTNHFTHFIFDRLSIVTIEKSNKNTTILEHIQILKFNKEKYNMCFKQLP